MNRNIGVQFGQPGDKDSCAAKRQRTSRSGTAALQDLRSLDVLSKNAPAFWSAAALCRFHIQRIIGITCVGACVFISASASAQVGGAGPIAKQRAREQVNQSNVRQGVAAPVQPTTPPASTTTPPAQNVSLTRLQTALASFKSDGTFTPQQKQKFTNDLFAAALSTKPAPAAASKLADDMALVLAGKPLSPASRSRLATELDSVLNPSKYPQAKIQAIYDDIQAVFQENGADRRQAVAIVDDIKALGTR